MKQNVQKAKNQTIFIFTITINHASSYIHTYVYTIVQQDIHIWMAGWIDKSRYKNIL